MTCVRPRNRLVRWWDFHRPDPQAVTWVPVSGPGDTSIALWPLSMATALGATRTAPRTESIHKRGTDQRELVQRDFREHRPRRPRHRPSAGPVLRRFAVPHRPHLFH